MGLNRPHKLLHALLQLPDHPDNVPFYILHPPLVTSCEEPDLGADCFNGVVEVGGLALFVSLILLLLACKSERNCAGRDRREVSVIKDQMTSKLQPLVISCQTAGMRPNKTGRQFVQTRY